MRRSLPFIHTVLATTSTKHSTTGREASCVYKMEFLQEAPTKTQFQVFQFADFVWLPNNIHASQVFCFFFRINFLQGAAMLIHSLPMTSRKKEEEKKDGLAYDIMYTSCNTPASFMTSQTQPAGHKKKKKSNAHDHAVATWKQFSALTDLVVWGT